MKRVGIIIPAYNEAKSLSFLLREFPKTHQYQILLIDDGSTDNTSDIGKNYDIHILRNVRNYGAGASTFLGLKHMARTNVDYVVFMDADGQHNPRLIPKLITQLRSGDDFVIGSRYITAVPAITTPLRVMGTKIISIWIALWYGARVYDPTSGFRALNMRAFVLFSKKYPTFFSEPEAVLIAIENGLKIGEVPCQMRKRYEGKSSISLNKAIILMIYIIVIVPYRFIKHVFRNV